MVIADASGLPIPAHIQSASPSEVTLPPVHLCERAKSAAGQGPCHDDLQWFSGGSEIATYKVGLRNETQQFEAFISAFPHGAPCAPYNCRCYPNDTTLRQGRCGRA